MAACLAFGLGGACPIGIGGGVGAIVDGDGTGGIGDGVGGWVGVR